MSQFRTSAFVRTCLAAALSLALTAATVAQAAEGDFAEHKLVIQVSTDDARTQTIALNNAANLQKSYGIDNVAIELVAYGPGLSLLLKDNAQAGRIQDMAMQGITFSACGNTIEGVTRKTGNKPEINESATVVSAGVSRILELQENGYGYIRP